MNPNLGHPVKNKNKVQVKQWAKWSNHAKRIFNDMYYALRPSMQATVSHPEALALAADHWQTIRWNAAWLAADAANENGGAARAVKIRQPESTEHNIVVKPTKKKYKYPKKVSMATIIKATRDLTLKSVAKKRARKPKGKRRG